MTLPAPRTFTVTAASATVYDHGAHVVAWSLDGQPVLWLSQHSAQEPGQPIRGGVPICFPWFGPGRSKAMRPAHGPARLATWTFLGETSHGATTRARYRLTSDEVADPQGSWEAVYEIRVGAELELALTVTSTGSEPFSYEEALHTYLAVGDVRQVEILGLDGAWYLDKAPGGADGVQSQALRITGETDRVYRSTAEVEVVDPVLERRIRLSKQGSAQTVVWNPWVDKARAMPDFGDDEWPQMLCVEAVNALDQAVELEPGQSHTVRQRIRLETV